MRNSTVAPLNEELRLKALYETHVLDTEPEAFFDELAKFAANTCNCPISLISFVDKRRQWFKAAYGISAKQADREGGFCAHAILETDVFIVEDATTDHRFATHPFVTGDPKIRFYAAMPIVVGEGYQVGVICVIDTKPRVLNDEQMNSLKSLATTISLVLENRRRSFEIVAASISKKAS